MNIQQINYQGKSICFSDDGKGKVLVLLHGFLESLHIWKQFTSELSKTLRVVCIDLPGHGGSEGYAEEHTMDSMAVRVKAVLDHLEIKKCIMIGHSMGGYVTLAFADLYTEHLTGFGLFHSAAHADSAEAAKNRDRAIQAIESDHQNFIYQFIPSLFAEENILRYKNEIEKLKREASQIKKENIIAALKGMRSRPIRTDLLKLTKLPVIFIIGEQDSRIPADLALEQADLPIHSNTLVLPNAGHMGYIEAKNETMEFIRNFVVELNF
jgi:pimeloyl-ACP methyl ester carboxylesterase